MFSPDKHCIHMLPYVCFFFFLLLNFRIPHRILPDSRKPRPAKIRLDPPSVEYIPMLILAEWIGTPFVRRQSVNLFLAGEGIREETKNKNREGGRSLCSQAIWRSSSPGGLAIRRSWRFRARRHGSYSPIKQATKAGLWVPLLSLSSPPLFFFLVLFFLLRFHSIFEVLMMPSDVGSQLFPVWSILCF